VLLLHGFPEFWYSWRHQLPALAGAGFTAIAPDLRGYNLSDKPEGVRSYTLAQLTADVAALAASTGQQQVDIVGHDWGGVIAWSFAARYPALLRRLVIINAPHPSRYRQLVWRPPQLFRSWYVLVFQIPGLAERLLAARDYSVLRSLFTGNRRLRAAFSAEDVDLYVEAISRRGALTAALNYYRAMRVPGATRLGRPVRTDAETLVIWGERDKALVPAQLEGLERYARRLQVRRLPEASHWAQNEAPGAVNAALIDFLSGPSAT
jgi:epoxide hydrolase 4